MCLKSAAALGMMQARQPKVPHPQHTLLCELQGCRFKASVQLPCRVQQVSHISSGALSQRRAIVFVYMTAGHAKLRSPTLSTQSSASSTRRHKVCMQEACSVQHCISNQLKRSVPAGSHCVHVSGSCSLGIMQMGQMTSDFRKALSRQQQICWLEVSVQVACKTQTSLSQLQPKHLAYYLSWFGHAHRETWETQD